MINSSIYDVSSQYAAFIEHEHQQAAELRRYMNEAVCLCEGVNVLDNMQVIQEGLYEDIKDKINKVAAFIKKMWLKFLEVMNRLVRTNKSYLNRYKDAILKNKFKEDVTYNSYDWKTGYERVMTDVIVTYNDEKKLVAAMKSKDDFIAHNYPEISRGYKAPYDFTEMCKSYFRGGDDQIELKAADLNGMIRSMYDYCYSYDEKVKDVLEKDYNDFMNQAGTLMDKFIKAQREAEKSGNSGNTGSTNESSIWEEETAFSSIYEGFINEDGQPQNNNNGNGNNGNGNLVAGNTTKGDTNNPPKTGSAPSNGNGNNGGKEPPKGSGATVTANNGNNNNNQNGKTSDRNASLKNTDVNGNGNSVEEIKQLGEAVSEYVNIRNTYLTCRMSAAEAMYKDYMIIIRDHVSNTVGNTTKATRTAGSSTTTSTQTNTKETNSEDNGFSDNGNNNNQQQQNNNNNGNQQ